jgi:predicted aspartyl protease
MKFKYFKFPLEGKSIFFGSSVLKPIIPIKIINKCAEIKFGALIDSGADFCIFDAEIGENLGLDVKSGSEEIFGGIQNGGFARAYIHEVKLNIGGWEYVTRVGFSYDIAKYGYGILGQKGFFDLFIVRFDYKKEEIELKEKL